MLEVPGAPPMRLVTNCFQIVHLLHIWFVTSKLGSSQSLVYPIFAVYFAASKFQQQHLVVRHINIGAVVINVTEEGTQEDQQLCHGHVIYISWPHNWRPPQWQVAPRKKQLLITMLPFTSSLTASCCKGFYCSHKRCFFQAHQVEGPRLFLITQSQLLDIGPHGILTIPCFGSFFFFLSMCFPCVVV